MVEKHLTRASFQLRSEVPGSRIFCNLLPFCFIALFYFLLNSLPPTQEVLLLQHRKPSAVEWGWYKVRIYDRDGHLSCLLLPTVKPVEFPSMQAGCSMRRSGIPGWTCTWRTGRSCVTWARRRASSVTSQTRRASTLSGWWTGPASTPRFPKNIATRRSATGCLPFHAVRC